MTDIQLRLLREENRTNLLLHQENIPPTLQKAILVLARMQTLLRDQIYIVIGIVHHPLNTKYDKPLMAIKLKGLV